MNTVSFRKVSRFIVLCLFAAYWHAAAAHGAEITVPTALLTEKNCSAVVYLPDAKNGFYRSTRFDRGSMMRSLACNGMEFFTEWRHPDTYPEINNGAGPSEEFDFGLEGATTPPGYDEAKIGEEFLKIGVGWLRKKTDTPYMPFFPLEVVDEGVWHYERLSVSSVRIIHTTDPSRKYAYRLTRTITIKADPARLIIERELFNTGSATIKTSHYCHNFIRLSSEAGTVCRLTLPFTISFDVSIPAGWKISGSDLTFENPQKNLFGVKPGGVKPGETSNSFTITDMKSGAWLRCGGDKPLSSFAIFADAAIFCPEPFVAFSVTPGNAVKWTNTYEISILAIDGKF